MIPLHSGILGYASGLRLHNFIVKHHKGQSVVNEFDRDFLLMMTIAIFICQSINNMQVIS
jgi:hypothetical protein